MKILVTLKKCNYSAKSKYYDDSNKVVVGKMKDKTAGTAVEEFDGLKPKIYSVAKDLFSVDNYTEHRKANDVNKNVIATISHNIYKVFC